MAAMPEVYPFIEGAVGMVQNVRCWSPMTAVAIFGLDGIVRIVEPLGNQTNLRLHILMVKRSSQSIDGLVKTQMYVVVAGSRITYAMM